MCKSIIHKPAQGPVIDGQTETCSESSVSLVVFVIKDEAPLGSPFPALVVLFIHAVFELIAPLCIFFVKFTSFEGL